jgi:hypothetical protein
MDGLPGPLSRDLGKAQAVAFPGGRQASEGLPPQHRHVHIGRRQLQGVAAAPTHLSGDEDGAGAAERFVHRLARAGVILDRPAHALDRLRPLDKGDVYKLLNLRTYVGEVEHKGKVYAGEHKAIVPRELWDRVHAALQVSPRTRASQNRQHAPALLKGLIYGADGRALSPTHSVKNGRLYRYYVAQRVLKGDAAGDDSIVRRVLAAEIETAVVDQVRALLRQPEVVVGTWVAARAEAPDLREGEVREALVRLEPLWGELFPAEQARIVRALVERVVVGPAGADIRLRVEGLTGLVRDLTAITPDALRVAA